MPASVEQQRLAMIERTLRQYGAVRPEPLNRVPWIETYLDIRDRFGRLRPFILTEAQNRYVATKAAAIEEGKKPFFLVLKSRKVGITTLEQAESYQMAAEAPYRHCITLADVVGNTQKIFEIAKIFKDRAVGPARPPMTSETKSELSFWGGRSLFWIGTAGSKAFGRGTTVQRAHGSEVAWWQGNMAHQENLIAGLMEAAAYGELILETTANGAQGWFYEEWRSAKKGDSQFTPIFIPWWWDSRNRTPLESQDEGDDILSSLGDEEAELHERYRLTAAQIKWRRGKVIALKRLFPQEYPEDDVSAFLFSGICYFDVELLDRLVSKCLPPMRRELGGKWTTWEDAVPGRRYVIGVDCAEGIPGRDFSAACALDYETGAQVARVYGHWRPHEFSKHVGALGRRYNTALLGVERENHGHAVLDGLLHSERYPRPMIYHHQHYDARTREKRRRIGWTTNGETRPILLDSLAEALESGSMRVNDQEFLAEAKVFQNTGTGRYEAASGEHDDLVIAWGIANRMRLARQAQPRLEV